MSEELKTGRFKRAAFLIDAEAYFQAVAESLKQAEKSALIIGWDIDSRIRLDANGDGKQLAELLNEVVKRRPALHVHILIWDFPMAYGMDREPLQFINFTRKTHKRIHFHLDDELPLGSSHHQKIVVVDDRVAFVGGMDLTSARWDTPEHLPVNDTRTTPGGDAYGPYHDVQMAVDGEIAAAVGRLARMRWLWATGQELDAPRDVNSDPWPASAPPQLHDEQASMALTLPSYKRRAEVRQIEAMYLRELAQARSKIYIENQYFTAPAVRSVLAERLMEEDGPEIMIILPQMSDGLLEQLVMEPLQSDILDALRSVDAHGRLAVYCPFADREGRVPIKVHSKLLIVDDAFITVGSANLNNRSMGLDTECNLALRPSGRQDAIRDFRLELVAHHLGLSAEAVAREEARAGGMIKAVESLRRKHPKLLPEADVRKEAPPPVKPDVIRALDSSRPSRYDAVMDEYSGSDNSEQSFYRFLGLGVGLSLLIALALAWRFTPLSAYLDPNRLLQWTAAARQVPGAPFLAAICFTLGSLAMVPVTMLILLTASIFDPLPAFAISLAGCMASSALAYSIGQVIGHEPVKKFAGGKINAVSEQLGKHGLFSIIVLRVLPMAPFSVINLAAGASHIGPGVFLSGTALGMTPGLIGMTLFGGQLMRALCDPGPLAFAILGLIALLALGLGVFLKRRLKRLRPDGEGGDSEGAA